MTKSLAVPNCQMVPPPLPGARPGWAPIATLVRPAVQGRGAAAPVEGELASVVAVHDVPLLDRGAAGEEVIRAQLAGADAAVVAADLNVAAVEVRVVHEGQRATFDDGGAVVGDAAS